MNPKELVRKIPGMRLLARRPSEMSLQERERRFDKIFTEHPITNIHVWLAILRSRRRHFITSDERDRVTEYYRSLYLEGKNVSVAALLESARIGGVANNPLLKGICFNYDLAREEGFGRVVGVLEDSQKLPNPPAEDQVLQVYYFVNAQVQAEFRALENTHVMETSEQQTIDPEKPQVIYRLSSPFLFLVKDKFNDLELYKKGVIPFLSKDEAVRPGFVIEMPGEISYPGFDSNKPHVVTKFL